jgi:hypothetical protein
LNKVEVAYLLSSAENQKEGLPIWIFYIALCAILLLLFLAFLHNKDLRNKINNIFLVYKKRFMKFGLVAVLRHQERKKNKLLTQLGQQGVLAWPELKEISEATFEISSLEKKKQSMKESGRGQNSAQLEPHYQAIGLIINKIRPGIEVLTFYYSKLDKAERRIKILKQELENF